MAVIFEEWVDPKVTKIMEKMDYKPNTGLGAMGQGVITIPDFKGHTSRKGLGYQSGSEKPRPKGSKLMDYFVKAKYQGAPEPCEVNGVTIPGFEIFDDVVGWKKGPWTWDEKSVKKTEEEWKEELL